MVDIDVNLGNTFVAIAQTKVLFYLLNINDKSTREIALNNA